MKIGAKRKFNISSGYHINDRIKNHIIKLQNSTPYDSQVNFCFIKILKISLSMKKNIKLIALIHHKAKIAVHSINYFLRIIVAIFPSPISISFTKSPFSRVLSK